MADNRILLVTFPGLGHINPALEFAKRVIANGVNVTFSTSISIARRMSNTSIEGLEVIPFSDGYDGGWTTVDNYEQYIESLRIHGSKAVEDIIKSKQKEGKPFKQVVYSILVPWVGEVAQHLDAPSTVLWVQPATTFNIMYKYAKGYLDNVGSNDEIIELPGLPVLESCDLPSFFQPSSPSIYSFALPEFREHFEVLDKVKNPTVLINTFEALEPEQLRAINKYKVMAIGPLVPSAKEERDTTLGGHYVEWLDGKEKSSVIYVAFGSFSDIPKEQIQEIAKGLVQNQRPFLWVIRGADSTEKLTEILPRKEDLERQGKIIPWCSQIEVLSHPSLGCFLSHCGWNSTIESLVHGVPVVGFPQWADQPTNAKLAQDYWKTGVRVSRNGKGIVEADEIQRCIDIVMGDGEKGAEIRKQAKKWKQLGKEAVKEGGTSDLGFKLFLDHITGSSHN